jgi:hypothetical protein
MNALVPPDAETILVYLLDANLSSTRTLNALRALCPGDVRADEALGWLMEYGYVYYADEAFELTERGTELARYAQIQFSLASSMSAPAPPSPSARGMDEIMPTVNTHPLRVTGRIGQPDDQSPKMLNYVLAFEMPKNALPIPVLDGDILGRLETADISLVHDDFISGKHCSFKVNCEKGQPVLYMEDLGSRNGTFVNDNRLYKGQVVELKHGDRVHVGSTILIVVRIPY